MSDTTDALESLLASEGWRLYMEHVRTEWSGAGYGRKVKDAVSTARANHDDAAAAVDKVDYANDQIGDVIAWPKQECARLKRQEDAQKEQPIRTPISAQLAMMGRRGTL